MAINLIFGKFSLNLLTILHLLLAIGHKSLLLKIRKVVEKFNKNFAPSYPITESLDYLSK